ncbi:MAG: hypothetical protein M0Z78_06630 [Betaproteobacteria bacterium]|nr:hypothetical protein [Betaproteobacteria bacterium]
MSFLSQMTTLHWVITGGALLCAVFYWWIRSNQPVWFDFLYSFPIPMFGHIGKLGKLKKDTSSLENSNFWGAHGMPTPEVTLCSEYAAVMKYVQSQISFERANEYLALINQRDTKPMAWWALAILFVLTVAEAMGTGFLMAPFISSEMSSSQIGYAGWILAVAMAIMLLILTHHAGKVLKKKSLIKKNMGKLVGDAPPDGVENHGPITVDQDQSVDSGKTARARFYLRALANHDRGSLHSVYAVCVLLALVLAMVFVVRWEGIKKQNTIEVVQMEKSGIGDSGASGNPFASADQQADPPDVVKSQAQSRKKIALEIGSENLGQGFGAAFLLALIYLLTQAAGAKFAFESAFIAEGEKAYQLTRGETDYRNYHAKYILPFESRADSRLAELRRYFSSVTSEYKKNPPTVTFRQFLQRRQSEMLSSHQENIHSASAVAAGNVSWQAPTATRATEALPANASAISEYHEAAGQIMSLPGSERGSALEAWLDKHGKEHTEGLLAAISALKEARKAALESPGSKFANLLMD